METNNLKSIQLTAVEKRLIECVDYIIYNTRKNAKPVLQKEILSHIDLASSSYSSFKNGLRKMPFEKFSELMHVLISHYGVSRQYLEYGKGSIMHVNSLQEEATKYQNDSEEVKKLRDTIEQLKNTLADKIKIIEAQDSVIKNLNAMLEMMKPGKN